ncbi:EAL domain-containing protein [Massilia sp. IC2-477]|uniref:sensor domain-containing phosphodiesterase n=1 Tax=Massilia sp. IC2-477 TaxID=2887198 RepID=UPI001D10FC2F|nr:EAL domain-containing protein [Massilia sp. IC2-477]MCC2958252.1 EAL domain-containing protein [Massilia sp. IC2-477]
MPTQQSPAPLHDIIESAVDLARICLRMDVAFISEFKNGLRIFRHIAADGELPVQPGHADPLSESYCQHIIDGSIPSIVDDSHIYPILKRLDCTEAMRIRAHLGVPIRLSDGSVFGTFCCYSRRPSASLREVDVEGMARFARLIADMLEQRVLSERAREEASLRLSEVIARRALAIAYQPIVALADGAILGYEALSRFPAAADKGPAQWFDDAHRVDKGSELELLAIELALGSLAQLPPSAYLSLNVSPRTILDGSLAMRLGAAPLDRLVLEVTEHAPVEEYAAIAASLDGLRRGGLRLAIDDAGSGYASFRHILQLRPDIIKLDQSLIRQVDLDPGRRALAAALTMFARDTGCDVVAEGVETDAELGVLRGLGIKAGQGYLFGRPALQN